MTLSETQQSKIEEFRKYIEDAVAQDDRYGQASRHDRADQSTLATRFQVAPKCWLEVAVRPFLPQVRVGFLTNDRWKSEECEQLIEDSGDTMSEFIGLAFADANLDWPEPVVEHYREAGEYFYFATPLPLEEIADLDNEHVRNKVLQMLEGYLIAFGPVLPAEEGSDE